MASSIRSFYQVCCRSYYLRVSTFFPSFVSVFAFFFVLPFSPSFFLPYPLSASHSLKVSFYRTHLKTVHTFRALSSNSLLPFSSPRSKLLTSEPSRFLCIQLIFSPDLLVEFLVFCQQEQATFVPLTKRHESFRDGKWKEEQRKSRNRLLFFVKRSIDLRGSLFPP